MFDYLYGWFVGFLVSLVCLPPTFVVIALLPRPVEQIKILFPVLYAAFLFFAAALASYILLSHGYRRILGGLWIALVLALALDAAAGALGLAWYHPYELLVFGF